MCNGRVRERQTWDQVIEAALADARCVIVLWSLDSIRSDWVRAEADDAKQRGILVPVLLDDMRIPLAFRGIQAAHLVGWSGAGTHPEFQGLCAAVAGMVERPSQLKITTEVRTLPHEAGRSDSVPQPSKCDRTCRGTAGCSGHPVTQATLREVACYDHAKPRDEWVSTELKDLASLMLPAFLKARIVKLRYAQHSTIN